MIRLANHPTNSHPLRVWSRLVCLFLLAWPAVLLAQVQVDVNRPRSPFDCLLPVGRQWYGSEQRCLAYLCEGFNVYNEYVFDSHNRRRKNPCYGQSPTELRDPGEGK
ncbi:MAG: hypothetical protein KatS3mg077_0781 [Candidatus Binatia bacterium]|nr:MAG: hypothetical protein KatS3mg077_0781 [Candidatus Binatia bacterium]